MGITRISRLRDCGIFRDFTWPSDLPDFGRYNLVYGWNGTGKTTLSRILRCLEQRTAPAGQVMIALDGRDVRGDDFPTVTIPVRVFNREFMAENVFPVGGGDLAPIFVLGADALAWLGDQFRALRDTVMKVVGGIADALAAGDIALAAQILWLSLKLAWQQGVAALNTIWLQAKRFFLSTVQTMWFGALALAEQVFHALEVAWIETTAFLSKTWTSFTSGFHKAWNTAINWTTKRLLDLWSLLDDTFANAGDNPAGWRQLQAEAFAFITGEHARFAA